MGEHRVPSPPRALLAERPDVEMRIRFHEHLGGTYWTATSGDGVTLDVSGESSRMIDRAIIYYANEDERTIELRAPVPMAVWSFTFVREDTLVPSRDTSAAPESAPASIR